ncbi:MAG TPA: cyclic nucleotide-binding domain-containing protein, partial [Chromatiaceae bacterium]|nr:cyclic nucleotide-binding domain-containing protein [Chromatiaceae bacterium]
MGLESNDIDRLDAIVQRNRPLQRGSYLFQTGEPFRKVYVVKTGTMKTYTQCPDGSEQVIGFHLPGEVIGLDGIEMGKYICTAKALETSAICEIPFNQLEELTATIPNLQHQMFRRALAQQGHETGVFADFRAQQAEHL